MHPPVAGSSREVWASRGLASVGAALIAIVLLVAGCSTPRGDDGGPNTTPAASTTAPGNTGQPFAQPPELRSANGVLRVTLTAEEREVTIAGVTVRGRVFNGSFVAPTLRLQPGDRLEVTLVNKLPQMTNLHTHGFHVSPQANSDNVFRMVDPGATATYVYELSRDFSPGTYWYHPHMHGEVESQIFGGMSGVIIVEGLPRYLPAGLRDVEERTISLKDFQHKDGAIPARNIDSDAPTTRVVNGLRNPAMTIRPGETQLWRLANIGADIWYQVALQQHRFHIIAEDANPVSRVWAADSLVLPPGKRYDVLVQAGPAGQVALETQAFDQGGDQYPMATLATVQVAGAQVEPADLPVAFAPADDLSTVTVDRRRTLVFTEEDKANKFFIDGKQFNPNRIDQLVGLNGVEEWTIRNQTSELHPFHIHVNDFQVQSVNQQPFRARSWADVVPLPIKGEVVVRMRFRNFTGKYVYHCHIVAHEDLGMMAVVDVT